MEKVVDEINTHRLSLDGLQKILETGKGVEYFKSGRNHPWHISNRFFFDKDVKKKRTPNTITNDCDHTDRNLKWWHEYKTNG